MAHTSRPDIHIINTMERMIMGELSGTLIYWYMFVGLIVGLSMAVIIGKEGISFIASIIFGVIGGLALGVIGLVTGIGDGVFFSFVGTWLFLFLINVLHQLHMEELADDLRDAKSIYKKHSASR